MADYKFYLDYLHHVDDETKNEILDKENAIRDSYENQLSELKEIHNADKEKLRKQAQKDKADLKAEMASAVAKAKEEMEAYKASAESKEKQLVERFEAEIEALKTDAEDREKLLAAKYEEKTKLLRDKAKKEKEDLKAEMKEAADSAKETADAYRNAAENKEKKLIEQYDREVKELRDLIEKERADHKAEVEHLQGKNDVASRTAELAREKLVKDNDKKIKTLNDKINEMTRKYANVVPIDDFQSKIVELQEQHDKELADKCEAYNKEFETIKAKVSQGVKELKDEITRLNTQIRVQKQTIDEMKHGSIITKVKHLFFTD